MPDESREIIQAPELATRGALALTRTAVGTFTVAPQNMGELIEFAKVMSMSGQCVRPVFRGNPGACLAVSLQAFRCGGDPFAWANKSYIVNDQLAYEAQLIHSLVNSSSVLQRRLRPVYEGEGQSRRCRIVGWVKGENEPLEYESPTIGSITVKNSPLWKSDPDQQLFYFSARAWARRHVPEILLGMYSSDELETIDVTPASTSDEGAAPARLTKLEQFETRHGPSPEPDDDGEVREVADAEATETAAAGERDPSKEVYTDPEWPHAPAPAVVADPSPEVLALIARGQAAAARGTDALQSWWQNGLSALQRGALGARGRGVGPYLESWKIQAAAIDARASERAPVGDLLGEPEQVDVGPQSIVPDAAAPAPHSADRPRLDIDPVLKNGKPDWRTWTLGVFMPKLRRFHDDVADLAFFIADNEENIGHAKAAGFKEEIDAAISEQFRVVDGNG